MKQSIIIILLAITFVACQTNNELEDKVEELSKKVETLEASRISEFKPGLGTLMNSIQTHHLKLWKSGIAENWELANFELHELEERFEDIEKYHKDHSETKQLEMIFPQIENLEKAAKEKNKSAFVSGYESLTATCNSCHQLNEHPFIRITTPNSNSENQIFTP